MQPISVSLPIRTSPWKPLTSKSSYRTAYGRRLLRGSRRFCMGRANGRSSQFSNHSAEIRMGLRGHRNGTGEKRHRLAAQRLCLLRDMTGIRILFISWRERFEGFHTPDAVPGDRPRRMFFVRLRFAPEEPTCTPSWETRRLRSADIQKKRIVCGGRYPPSDRGVLGGARP